MGAITTLLTFEEFEKLPDAPGKRELLDGELIELPPPKFKHAITQHRIARALEPCADSHGLVVFVELGFRLGKDRNAWLQPDVSVVRREHVAQADPEGYLEVAPLIAIEVISPGNTAEAVERKLARYFENGAAEVWIVYPKTRRIWRYDSLQTHVVIGHGVFTSPLLPGFEMDLAELFR